VAPTLLYTLGLAVPRDLEGRVVEQLFLPASLRERPIHVGDPTHAPVAFPEGPDPQEKDDGEAQVLERLKNLGYVE
jgi:hypothetical protein